MQVSALLFRPPIFDPRKLTTTFLPGTSGTEPQPPAPRRYTLTHNDITGQLNLSIGCNYNTVQVSGWYTRLIRCEAQRSEHVHVLVKPVLLQRHERVHVIAEASLATQTLMS